MLLLTPMIAGLSHKRWQWLPLRVWRHVLAFVTRDYLTLAFVIWLSLLLWKIWCHFPSKSTVMLESPTKSCWSLMKHWKVNSSPPGQNGHRFTDDIFRCIFMNEKFCIVIKNSVKFVPKYPVDNIPELVQIIAWRRIGEKPLSDQYWPNPITHICGTRGRWVKKSNVFIEEKAFVFDQWCSWKLLK